MAAKKAKAAPKKGDLSDDEILEELGLDTEEAAAGAHSQEEARIIAGFEEITRFVTEHKRKPQHGEGKDIFERLYAVRLERIRGNATYRALVTTIDEHGLLAGATGDSDGDEHTEEMLDDDALLAELGAADTEDSITNLKHVKPRAEVHASEPPSDVATRKECSDFARVKPLFQRVQKELDTGKRETRRVATMDRIAQGEFFILDGQLAYVAEVGAEERRTKDERTDHRLRVVFDNGTESNLLMRSFQRALHKDETSRLIADMSLGPLFGTIADSADLETGTLYVLRSKSAHPYIAAQRGVIHKIGVTGNELNVRTQAAEYDATFLFAEVEIVAKHTLYNINRSKLENLLHRFFASARLDIEIPDRFGRTVRPREWFVVPLDAIQQAVDLVAKGTLTQMRYDPETASIVWV
jgi:T5orf172 domain